MYPSKANVLKTLPNSKVFLSANKNKTELKITPLLK